MTITRKTKRTTKRSRPRSGSGPWKVLQGAADRVRWSRVQTAQARIVSGYYEREEVQGVVVTEILKELIRH
jgi:hypothetical protein